jgi:hypothetical protein
MHKPRFFAPLRSVTPPESLREQDDNWTIPTSGRNLNCSRSLTAHERSNLTSVNDIVQKLWNLCHVLRDDGISYLQYVTELTYLLFLKMMQETGAEATQLPEG